MNLNTDRQILTSTFDHVVFVGSVQRPTVVLAVVQVVPATGRNNAANTHLETTRRLSDRRRRDEERSTHTHTDTSGLLVYRYIVDLILTNIIEKYEFDFIDLNNR